MTWRAASFRAAGSSAARPTVADATAAGETEDAGPEPVQTLLALVPANSLEAGTNVPSYWAARSGRALSTYWGAYVLLGAERFLWWSHEGSLDPGAWVPALAGLTGHEVELPAGNVSPEDVATATAAVIDAIDGWATTQNAGELLVAGPEAVTVGPGWDAAEAGGMAGMRSITVAAPPTEGPITTVIAQHLPNPGIARPIVAVDVYLGSAAVVGDRWRVALWTAVGGTATPAGEARLVDLGQVPASQIGTSRWARIPMPAGTVVLADQAMWASFKGNVGTTQVGGRLAGDTLRGDWTSQNLQQSDGGISTDPTVAWPATWPGTTSASTPFVCGCRLVIARTSHDASHHSEADPAVWGTHVPVGDLGSSIDLDSRLFMVAPSPPFLGMRLLDAGWAVGAVRGTQPRLGAMIGGVATEPPDPDGATVLADGGQLTGASTLAWEDRSLGGVAWPASTPTAWAAKCDDDATGTQIAFAQDPSQVNANPPESPMDWLPAESSPGPFGSEYEEFGADNDPTTPFVSPYVAPASPARPRNVPGARLRYYGPGITATPV